MGLIVIVQSEYIVLLDVSKFSLSSFLFLLSFFKIEKISFSWTSDSFYMLLSQLNYGGQFGPLQTVHQFQQAVDRVLGALVRSIGERRPVACKVR